ncbi:hypothetical protein GPECTOR_20g450 [Gonium pectorale]|uniref:Aminoglycoside phosphotransferase domain-containing protein n=1 Tax=Gonium pectorale TaxID=33097 RepID=A0A150GIF2_GONPE|nr:hypothetical protein GPECTOR_20g450 [Gonium pectorale]|eukprot:KXZ49594.1 hypothetical protein GPECTOR_20g450 [Gonium pectorale]
MARPGPSPRRCTAPTSCATLVLLLEGPRLSICAVWTIYQNRVAYAPLTPSYYLANQPGGDLEPAWQLVVVLNAYGGEALVQLQERYKKLAWYASERPCTLPYVLLDEQLGLSDVAYLDLRGGGGLLYTATQCCDGCAGPRRVLIKFTGRRYAEQVHRAWHRAGVAPELHDVVKVAGRAMVVMEHLDPDQGWKRLSDFPLPQRTAALKAAVQQALTMAHAVDVGEGRVAVHGDCRGPNIMVREERDGGAFDVRFIDFDWAGVTEVDAYPMVLLAPEIPWHPGVGPGRVLHQAHDTHLVEREWEWGQERGREWRSQLTGGA